MTVDLRHLFVSPVAAGTSNRLVQGPNWNEAHNLQQGPQTLLGRADSAAGQAATQEIQLDPSLGFVGGKLAAIAGGPPSGPAGGALSGTYPNPTLVGGPLSNYALTSSIPTTLPPSGAAGGDLAGTYPSPTIKPSVTNGQVLTTVGGVSAWATPAPSGGTVTTTSVVSANGLAGTVATATTTPAITLSTTVTGMLKGNGTAISAGTAGTDYMTPANVSAAYQPLDADLTALAGLNATAGLVEQTAAATYTKRLIGVANTTDIPTRANADARYAPISVNGTVTGASVVSANGFAGTVATATTTPAITLSTSITGMLKGNGTAISAGVAGTDYMTPANVSGAYLPIASPAFTGTMTGPAVTLSGDITSTGASGTFRQHAFQTVGVNRWTVGVTNVAEGGTADGSDFGVYRFDNTGGFLGQIFQISRATGATQFNGPLGASSTVTAGGNPSGAAVLNPGGSNTGYISFLQPDSTRRAYIGFGGTVGTGISYSTDDAGPHTFNNAIVGATATFSGAISANGFTAGYLEVPQQAQTGNYTAVLADSGKHLYHAVAAAAATYTIPANASVAYPLGATLTFVNDSANAVTIAITTDTLVLSPGTTTGSRTLATGGVATALKVTSTRWLINGTGLT